MWGYLLSTVGRCHEYCGGYLDYRGGYHDAYGENHEYRGSVQYHGECHPLYIEYRGGYHDTCGGYHEYRGGVQYHGGTQVTKDFPPTVLNTLHSTHDTPHVHHDIPR